MNQLLVDLGNSRWKLALATGDGITGPESGEYDAVDMLDESLNRYAGNVDTVWMSSVVDATLTQRVSKQVLTRLGVSVQHVGASDRMPGLVSGYRRPEQLGVDRLLAMVAIRAITRAPFCVVDAGTAVTIDFVDQSGQHQGGFILPGEHLFRDCLLRNTSIPREGDIEVGTRLGRDTTTAVALGARESVAAIVERFTVGTAALFGDADARVFVGGGQADFIMPLIGRSSTRIDDLVLRGLAVLARHGSN